MALSCNPILWASHPAAISVARSTPRRILFVAPGGACHAGPVASPRWALTPLFTLAHADMGGFFWRFPSGCPARALPGTIALWSPDFPREIPAAIQPPARALRLLGWGVRSTEIYRLALWQRAISRAQWPCAHGRKCETRAAAFLESGSYPPDQGLHRTAASTPDCATASTQIPNPIGQARQSNRAPGSAFRANAISE